MGIPAINSLANMEYKLYGNRMGLNQSAPSFTNGYRGGTGYSQYGTTAMNPYNYSAYNNPSFKGGSVYGDTYTSSNQNASQSSQVGFGASKADLDQIEKYYLKNSAPSESLLGAAGGGVVFGLMNNMRWILHPYNTIKSALGAKDLFKDIKVSGTELNKLWTNPDTQRIVSDFYGNVHKLGGLNPEYSRLPLFKTKLDKSVYERLMNDVNTLLKKKNITPDEMATLNEKIKVATNAKTGKIPQAFRWLKEKLGFTVDKRSVADKIADTSAIDAAKATAMKDLSGKLTLTKALKHSCTLKSGAMWMGMELLIGLPNIIKAFSKDSSTGMTQLGQTAVKGAGSAIGWAVGEGIGTWAGAALGAKIGTAISPGLGTAIGALAGVVCGSIGMWLTGKATNALVGQDVAEKLEVANLRKTPEGQVQLLQQTYQMAQNDKKLDPKTAQALQNVAMAYAGAA